MANPVSHMVPPSIQPHGWWRWSFWAVGIWLFPAGMLGVWAHCYTTVFGEPPCAPWAGTAIDGLFACSLVAPIVFVLRSRDDPVRFCLAFLTSLAQGATSTLIWVFAGSSVAGFYC